MKDLKKIFGGNRGLNQDNKKLVDSILRNSQREEPVIQQVVQAQGYRQGPQFGLPGPYQNRSFTGVCHFCGLPGHYARDCPAQRMFQPEFFRPPLGGCGREEVLVMALLEGEEEEEEEINLLCLKNLVCKNAMMK